MYMKMYIRYSTRKLLGKVASYKVCLWLWLCKVNTVQWGFYIHEDQILLVSYP